MATGLAVAKPILKTDIKNILIDFASRTNESANPNEYIEDFSEKLTNAIDKYVKEAIVKTTGTAAAQTGTLT